MDGWRKSTYSNANGGDCIEVGQGNGIAVRDSKDTDGGTLSFTAGAWQEFTASLRG
jgi:hypothetical protein